MPEDARLIQHELQHATGGFLSNRRRIVALSIFSSLTLSGIALFQVGLLKKIPQPHLPYFDAEKVNGSEQAYQLAKTPDALIGMASYAVTACLAAMGPQNRWKSARWIPLAMGAKALADASMAGKLSVEQWTKFRAFSFWSLLTSAATFMSLRYALPEMLRAFRQNSTR